MSKLFEINSDEDEIKQIQQNEQVEKLKKDSKLWGTPRLSPRREKLEPNVHKKVIFSAD